MAITKKKILYVTNEARVFYTHRISQALKARENGYEVVICSPDSPAIKDIEALGFRHILAPITRWGMNPAKELSTIRFLYRLYREERPCLVHHISMKGVLLGGVAALLARVPVAVYAISGLGFLHISKGFSAFCRRSIVRTLHRVGLRHPHFSVIFQNPDDREYFEEHIASLGKRSVLIRGSGVDGELFAPQYEIAEPQVPVVMMVSRLTWDKGVGEFVRAAGQIAMRGIRARWVLVGPPEFGNPAGVSEEQLEEWKERSPVEFWGHRENILSCLQQCQIACLPSYREGLPRFLIEAAALGKPIVATQVPGCREIVQDGVSGFLVPVKEEAPLVEALQTLLSSYELRSQMGRAGRAHFESGGFSEQVVVDQVMKLHDSLLREAGVEPPTPLAVETPQPEEYRAAVGDERERFVG